MVVSDAVAMIIVVLQSDFRKLAWIKGQVGRNPPTSSPIGICSNNVLISRPFVGKYIISTQAGYPSFAEAVSDLGVHTEVSYRFTRKRRNIGVAGESSGIEAAHHSLGLPGYKGKT